MIKLTDGMVLAFTKLQAKKVRTITTIVLASLLFGVLVAASLIMTGAFRSIDSFREDGLTGRHIVWVYKEPPAGNATQQILRDPDMVAEAKRRYEKLVKEKRAEANRLGIFYAEASDRPPFRVVGEGEAEALMPFDPNGIARSLLAEKFANEPAFDDEALKEIAEQYGAIDIFEDEIYSVKNGSSLIQLKSGKEVFYDQSDEVEKDAHYEEPLLRAESMILSAPEVTKTFRFSDDAAWTPESGAIPIILSQDTVERLLGMEKLSDKASPSDRLERLADVREQARNLSVLTCYRNEISSNLLQQTIRQKKDIEAHKDDLNYQKPKVIYELPDPSKCENPTIAEDTRYVYEKQQDEKQKQFDEKFGKTTEPVSYLVTFKVVGVSPAGSAIEVGGPQSDTPRINNLGDVVNSLLKTDGIWQAVPKDLYDQIPNTSKYADIFDYQPSYLLGSEDNRMRFVEFANSTDAQKFIDEQACEIQYDNSCQPEGRPYRAHLAYSNSAAIDDIRSKAMDLFNYATLGVVVLAAIVMWIAVGRTIADGRRETAVFRAIGFKRIDIATIYTLYTFLLSILIALSAAGLGFLAAHIANQTFASDLTTQAQYNFGGLDLSKEINLIGIDERQLGFLFAACLGTGLVSVIVPLLRNVRRNPIRDMRDEG